MANGTKVLRPDYLRATVGVVVGTRPGIVMLAPVLQELERRGVAHFAIHTGQHYSPNMDSWIFDDLGLALPSYRVEGTSLRTSHGAQTAHMLEGIEAILLESRPRLLLVGGDANTNLAGALAARKLGIMVGHIEAGERSFDWSMPEEHNRRIIDHISDVLFTTGAKAEENLAREAVQGRIVCSGNPIVDAARSFAAAARARCDGDPHAAGVERYAVLTLHREENVDVAARLQSALSGVSRASMELGIETRFYVHPRTRKRLHEFGLESWASDLPGLQLSEPLGFLDFTAALCEAVLVFTDSGGVQQEACIHHVSCVTLRDNTEWTETVELGANRIAGVDPESIVDAARVALKSKRDWSVPFGDGNAAAIIVDCVEAVLDGSFGGR